MAGEVEITYIFHCRPKVRLLLLPEEIDPKVLHQRREHIRHVLQCFGSLLQRLEQLSIRIEYLRRDHGVNHLPSCGR